MTEPRFAKPPLRPRAWQRRSTSPIFIWWPQCAFALVLIVVVAVRFAEPILDGDLFWQLKYAEQMIARGTLIPDHTLYSWTPATNDTIYCAWIGELLLYGLYQAGGLPMLFALRYLCIGTAAALLLLYARSRGVLARLPTLAIVFLSLLGAVAGTIIKPELLSVLAFHLVVFAYSMGRQADRTGADARPWFLAVPAIVLVWVNTHGGFLLGAPFFIATFVGEVLTRWRAPLRALSRRGLQAMLIGWALSALAVLLTPYGWRYPAQLVADYMLSTGPRIGESWNNAYQTVFGVAEILDYGVMIAAALLGLALLARRRFAHADWGLLIALILYAPLFVIYVRTTFYLAVVFGYAAIDLLAATADNERDPAGTERVTRCQRAWQIADGVAALAMIAAAAVALNSARGANKGSWIGFGVSYVNPVVEAEFLAASRLEPRLYNIFDAGGYLLWRLDPAYKVMIDPRFFPYQAWFNDLYAFSNGEMFADFLRKYPGDTAVIDLDRVAVWKNFLQSPDWKLTFYGPTSAVFVRRALPEGRVPKDFAPARFDHLRNGATALAVYDFALVIGDYATGWKVLAQVETDLRQQVEPAALAAAHALHEGYRLLAASDYDRAQPLFVAAASRPVQGWREPVILKLLQERTAARSTGGDGDVARYDAALRELAVSTP